MSDERCEPPEELRGVDGWHWVTVDSGGSDGAHTLWWWRSSMDKWRGASGEEFGPETAISFGFCYLMPCPTPSALAAAKEREAALVGKVREFMKESDRILCAAHAWDDAALAPFNDLEELLGDAPP